MTKYTSLAIALTATTFLSAPAIAVSLTPTLEENSAFSYSEGSESDYNFTLQEADVEGNLTTKYYNINLKPEQFTTSKSISWTEVDADQKDTAGVVEVKLPNDQAKYFKYTYTIPEGYETITKSELVLPTITNPSESANYQIGGSAVNNAAGNDYGNIENKVFKGNKVSGKIKVRGTKYKYLYVQGGAIYNDGIVGNVNADFIDNIVTVKTEGSAASSIVYGGAIYNNDTMGNINGHFVNNAATGLPGDGMGINIDVYGGAIYNAKSATIGNIDGNFVGNYVKTWSDAYGGAIYNAKNATIDNVTGDFIGNYASSRMGYIRGGAIFNQGIINGITGDFLGNHTVFLTSSGTYSEGGAIFNEKTIGSITGDFIGNYASSAHKSRASYSEGGAIYNEYGGTIGNITGDFISNYVFSFDIYSLGGAIANSGKTGVITGDFIGNYASSTESVAQGGAIFNQGYATIGNITGDFIGNYASSTDSYARGGAIFNQGSATIGNITGDFLNNYAKTSSDTRLAQGGAVYNSAAITFTSDANTHFMFGNYTQDSRDKIYNAIYGEETSRITLDTTGGGAWIINDNLEGGNYTFKGNDVVDTATGTTTQYVAMNNDIVNAANVKVEGTTLRFGSYQHEDRTAKNWDGKGAFVASLNADGTTNRDADAVTNLSLNNGVFDIANGYLETVKLKGYSATDSFLHIDVDPDNMKADELHIAGNVEGVTKMIVHASSNTDIRNRGQILFAQSENDTTGNAGSFVVSRVYKSPYLFDVKYDQIAENSNKWYFEMNNQDNPDKYVEPDVPNIPDVPSIKPQPFPGSDRPVAPEVINAESLPAAALAQNSNMVYNIMNKVSANRLYCPGCGFYDYYWNGEAFHNLWANAVYNTLRIKTPTDIDAEVWGIEAGGDLQHDINNKLGLFLSYRKGNYDMNGDGKHHYSTIGSEIDIDSYLAGLYYRYDRNNWWTFATVYGGIQKVDLKTKDGIKSDTDGVEFGGSVELGYDYAVNKTVYLTPSVGAFYTQVDYDDARDSAGKVAKYNTLRQLELEAGVKLTKAFVMDEGYANLYVKPSVVRTITDGDEVRITGLGKVNTVDDQTLGRIEVGGRYGFTEQLSAYGWANHTFGDDYKASTVGLGLSYSW